MSNRSLTDPTTGKVPGKEQLSLQDWLEMPPELLAEMVEPPTKPD